MFASIHKHPLPVLLCICLVGCGGQVADDRPVAQQPARYLLAWAADLDEREGDSNFLVTINVDPASENYGQVVATEPTGTLGGMPHHSELESPPPGYPLFANSFAAGHSWLFDIDDPMAPKLAGRLDSVPGYRKPHSFMRLSDGTVLATMQFGSAEQSGQPGGLARFAPDGSLLAVTSSADPAFEGQPIRTYALDVSEEIDRVITTSSPMDDERTADVVQLWRLSDLTLLRTIAVPEETSDSAWRYPFEVRFLDDDGTALMNTFYCGFYLLSGTADSEPTIERVMVLDQPEYTWCGVPVVLGNYWVMPVTQAAEVVVLDVADPRNPTVVSRLTGDSIFTPHWAAPDRGSDRIVLTSHAEADPRILIARLNRETGVLSWDETFRDPDSGELGLSFSREDWPHGATGPAMPHGTLFVP